MNYPSELRDRAIRMVAEPDYPSLAGDHGGGGPLITAFLESADR